MGADLDDPALETDLADAAVLEVDFKAMGDNTTRGDFFWAQALLLDEWRFQNLSHLSASYFSHTSDTIRSPAGVYLQQVRHLEHKACLSKALLKCPQEARCAMI